MRIRLFLLRSIVVAFCQVLRLALLPCAQAGSAAWNTNPTNSDWNTAANWTPATVPNSLVDIATFNVSNLTSVTISAATTVSGITFNSSASAYIITAPPVGLNLMISGVGISNNSDVVQTFVNDAGQGSIFFQNNATAGSQTVFRGHLAFFNSATAGTSNITTTATSFFDTASAGTASIFVTVAPGTTGSLGFESNATAANAQIAVQGAVTSADFGAAVLIDGAATASNATITAQGATVVDANGASRISFLSTSTAGNATLVMNGGVNGGNGGMLLFENDSTGGTARVEVFGNGNLDISQHKSVGVTIGSIEGDGLVFLGKWPLTLASSLSTTFSGVMQDGGFSGGGGTKGSLVRSGTGTLTLSGANIYTGGTTIMGGGLIASNTTGSATGTGAVVVNGGTLGGTGIISGAVMLNSGAFLAPAHGSKTPATITIKSALTFNSGSTYTYTYKAKGRKARTDKAIASGVTINSGATFNLSGTAQGALAQGLVLTVISNTAATPIAGTFANLPDGAVLTVGSNHLQASYEGGDGNDLTLTVVP